MGERKRKKLSVFMRYSLSYTLVVLVLFSGISVYLYRLTQQQVQESIVNTQINRLTRIAMQHESYIASMLNAAEEIGLSPYIEAFHYEQEPWKAYDLQLQLIPYTAASTFCDQVYLHFTEDDRLYSSSSSMTVSLFVQLMRYEHTSPQELEDLIRHTSRMTLLPAQKITSNLVDGSDPRMVTFLLPLGANPGTSKGSMLFLVKESTYQSLFADAIDGNVNTYIFFGDQVLSCSEDLPIDLDQVRAAPAEGRYDRIFRDDGRRYLAVTLPSRSWNMQYAAVLPMADVNSAVLVSSRNTFVFILLIGALGLLLSVWIARRHAKPIRAISGMLPENGHPREDELQQISTGIRALTQSNHELISRLDSALPMQRHSFIFRFVKGRFASREEAVAAAKAVGLEIDLPFYAVILCSDFAGQDRPFELNRPPLDGLPGIVGAGVELMALKASLYLVFSREKERLPALAERIRTEGRQAGGLCVTAISALHARFEEAPTAYLEAATAYDNRFAMGDSRVLAYDSISSDVADILPSAQKLTTGISQALKLGSRELLDERISELLQFLKNTRMSPFAFRMIYNDVINTLTRAQAAEFSAGRSAGDMYDIFSLSSCQSIDDLDEMLRRLCDTLLTGTAEGADSEEDVIAQVTRYMDEHFSDPEVSMAAIAESFDLSTTRLSLSFKEKMGMSPLEYLTLLRSEHAKLLLEQTDLTIRDIGAQVGYYDSGSFIRRFKQVTGVTPLQYRNRKTRESAPDEPA